MKIDDYNKVTDRLELKKDCLTEVFDMIEKDNDKKKMFSKRRIIPIAAAAVVACGTMTAVFADDIMGIFRKQGNFEISIASVDEPETQTVPIMKTALKKWDENTVNSLFIDGRNITKTWQNPGDIIPENVMKCFDFDDGMRLSYENGDIYFKHLFEYDYPYITSLVEYGINSGEVLFPKDEIAGLDKEAAVSQVDNILNELGIDAGEKKIIALDKDSLISADYVRNDNGERIDKHEEVLPEWTEEQEAYLIMYRVNCGDLPITDKGIDFEGYRTDHSWVHAVVGRNGIEYFNAGGIFDISESGKPDVEICTAEQAADAVCEKIGDNTYRPMMIENCKLTYVPIAVEFGVENEMHPYWEFYTQEIHMVYSYDNPELHERMSYDTIYVDAETCEMVDDVHVNLSVSDIQK